MHGTAFQRLGELFELEGNGKEVYSHSKEVKLLHSGESEANGTTQ